MQDGVARHPDRSPTPLTTRLNHGGFKPIPNRSKKPIHRLRQELGHLMRTIRTTY